MYGDNYKRLFLKWWLKYVSSLRETYMMIFFTSKEPSASEPMLDVRAFHFLEMRRLLSEGLGTFLLVLVAVGGSVVNAATLGQINQVALVIAPGLMVMAVILFMGKVALSSRRVRQDTSKMPTVVRTSKRPVI